MRPLRPFLVLFLTQRKRTRKGDEIMHPKAKKTSIKIGASAALATGITLASRFDLAISSTLAGLKYNGKHFTLDVPTFASVLEIIGEWAPSVLAATSALIFASAGSENCKTQKGKIAARAGSFIPAMGLMAYASSKTAEYLDYSLGGIAGRMMFAAFSFAIAAILYLLVGKIPPDIKKKLFLPAAYTLAASIAVLLTVSTLKTVWGRTRLRDLVDDNSLENYTPWYKPNFFAGEYSFPSGHTAHATLVLMLSKWLSGKSEKYRPAVTAVSYGFIALMAFSRLAAGAHFLSDILFGFLIALGITEFFKMKYEKHLAKTVIP
jgi:membrane-associated phospholipid phosphatase